MAALLTGAAGSTLAEGTPIAPRHPLGVLLAERVPLVAVGSASEVLRHASPTADVLKCRDRLEVLRVDAVAHPAQVVENVPIGDRADQKLEGDPMSHHVPSSNAHARVAGRLQSTRPEPAPRARDLDAPHEAATSANAAGGSRVDGLATRRTRLQPVPTASGGYTITLHRELHSLGVAPPEFTLAGAFFNCIRGAA